MAVHTGAPLAEDIRAFFTLDQRLVSDPYPLYARLRAEAPVFRDTERVLVSKQADVRHLLTSPTILQGLTVRGSRYRTAAPMLEDDTRRELAEMFGFLEKRLSGANGEHHARLRRLAQRAFTPRMVARMHDRIAEIAESLIAPLPEDGDVELISRYSYHLPLIVICEMLDIPPEGRDGLRRWANELGAFVGANWSDPSAVSRAHEGVFNLRRYLTDLFDERRGGSSSDLLTALIRAESDEGERFTEDELVAMITQFVFAGHETSTMFLGNALVALLGPYRSQWDELCADSSLIPAAVEELLRFASPTHNIDKLAAEDFEIGGVEVKQWDTVNLMLASANHDEDVYERADVLDIHREDTHHLTFGFGPHHCLGAALARLEAQVSLGAFTSRFPEMRIVTDEVDWRPTHMNRGPERLPVALGPKRRGR